MTMRRRLVGWFSRLSVARKLVGISVAASAAALAIAAVTLIVVDATSAKRRLAADAGLLADVVGANSAAAMAFGDAQAARATLEGLAGHPHVVDAAIEMLDGSVLTHLERRDHPATAPEPGEASPAGGARTASSVYVRDRLIVSRPVVLDGRVLGRVIVTFNLQELRDRGIAYIALLAGLLVVTLAIALGVAFRLQRSITTPLTRLAGLARLVSLERRYDARAVASGDDEIGDLVKAFNEMLEELQARDIALARHQAELETTVAERTAAWQEANQALARARDRAVEADRAKGEFLANISHEIRTPMNGIIGMTDVLLDTTLAAEQREYLQTVKVSTEGLLTVLNDVLDFSKIDAGRMSLERVAFDVRDVVQHVVVPVTASAHDRALDVIVEVGPDVPERLMGDPVRVRQVLTNLVSNAVKFTEKGHVLVEVRELARRGGRSTVHFSVSDTGIGIAREQHRAIFEAFRQADGSTTRRFGGTGLGLSISSRLVQLMGGTIEVASDLGIGSTFHFAIDFDLPTGAEPRAAETRPAPDAGARRRVVPVRVLLVEDNLVNERVATLLLGRRGHTVTVARSGQEALDRLGRERFDVVLMDLQMPGMGGLDATRAIRASERESGRHVRIIAMTAHAMTGDRERCLDAGMDGYLSKPIDRLLLFDAVERATSSGAMEADVTPDGPVFNHEEALARMGGDLELLHEIAEIFVDDTARQMAAIRAAIDEADSAGIRAAAHNLKGAAANLAAPGVVAAALALEQCGQRAALAEADAAWRRLQAEVGRLTAALTDLGATNTVRR